MKQLLELRESLDSIDDQIVKLLHQRADVALEVKRTKEKERLDIYSPARERQILNRIFNLVPNGHFPRTSLEKIFLSILSASRSLMGELCVSYVGPENSLGQVAALKQFGENLKFSPEASIEEVFAKVETGDSQYGIVPARTTSGNTTTTTTKTYDLLSTSSLIIIAEVEVKEKLSHGLESELHNDVRFFVLGQKISPQTGNDKTSLLCAVSEKAGALRDLLQPFSEYKITLLKIESRPIRTRGEEYGFYIDAFGHQQEPALQAALFKLNSLCSYVKVFGSYPLVYHS